MALTIEDLLNMQAAPRQSNSADVPAILAAMMQGGQQGMPQLPNMPSPIQPIALPQLDSGDGGGGGGSGLARQAISSLMGEYFQSRADEKQTKAESEQAKLLAQFAPQLYDERILAEKDPRAAAQLRADRAAFASENPVLAKVGLKNYESYLTSRMPDINASETIKNVRAAIGQEGTPEFQAGMKQELRQKNAPTGMFLNDRGELEDYRVSGGGTYRDIQDRISPLERSRLAISQAQEQRAIEAAAKDSEPLVQTTGPDGLPVFTRRSEAIGKQAYSATGISNKPLPTGQAKQVLGVENLSNGIDEYVSELKSWDAIDTFNPDKRAAMGTKFNNMMLQAKEAYNLGVLNGPDFEILQSVVTDPRTLTGAITSNEALEKQATELKRIMGKIKEVSSQRTGYTEQRPQLTKEQALEMLKKNGARFQ